MNDDELNQTYAAARTAGSQQRSVVPPRREQKPRMALMMAMAAIGAASMMANSRGNVIMVDHVTKRRDDNDPQLTAADMDAILAAKIKRERKALQKKMRHNDQADRGRQ
jgi:hypothetical protein